MRILFAGATGVLGRATLPHLLGHEVVAITRSPEKMQLLRELGADPVLCDVYDGEALLAVATRAQPQTVVNFVTDLHARSAAANNRARREGGANLRNAAAAAGASRLVVESVAFPLAGDAAQAVEELERSARAFGGEAVILRFGRLWGTGTFHPTPPAPPAIHVVEAAAEAARLVVTAPPGTYVVA
jgi:nucleoside-diphosphate-sugar epimerase